MTTIIDLSSDDEVQELKETQNDTPTTIALRPTNQKHIQGSQLTIKEQAKLIIDFVDHVVMIWLCRVRNGYKNLEMPQNILKSKAKEAAMLLDPPVNFSLNDWFERFQMKMKKMYDQGQCVDLGNSKAFRIEEIMKEEKPKFFKADSDSSPEKKTIEESSGEKTFEQKEMEGIQQMELTQMLEYQKLQLEKVKEIQRQQIEKVKETHKRMSENLRKLEEVKKKSKLNVTFDVSKIAQVQPDGSEPVKVIRGQTEIVITQVNKNAPQIDSAVPLSVQEPEKEIEIIDLGDVLDDPIESFEEALDCLSLVQDYLFSLRNVKGVLIAHDVETLLRKQKKLIKKL